MVMIQVHSMRDKRYDGGLLNTFFMLISFPITIVADLSQLKRVIFCSTYNLLLKLQKEHMTFKRSCFSFTKLNIRTIKKAI